MESTKTKSFIIKILVIIIIFIYFLYIFREKVFKSVSCSRLYNTNSFETCALSNKTCNITILLNAYMAYRTCVIQYSPTNVDYIVFDAVNGLGNRVFGLIAVMTYALVTSRVLLIDWEPGDNHDVYFEDLFLPLSSLSTDKIPFYYHYSLYRLANLIENKWMNKIERETKMNKIPQDWAFNFDRQILCNERIYDQPWSRRFGFFILNFIGHHVKWIRTDQYFVPLLTRNEKLRQTFITLFPNGQIFAELARKLLHPVPKVNSIVEDFQTKYNLKNQIVTIGVHMRSWSSSITNHIEPFQKCIEHVLKNISRLEKENIKIRLYIISNTPKRRQHLGNRISEIYKNLEILNPPEAPKDAGIVEKMQYTLAELLILSKMQHLIITSKSTFGMVAQGLARKGAWIVRQGAPSERQDIKSDLCEWESTSEPEYQVMTSLQVNDSCFQHGAFLPSIGERTIL